jgi:hypothetical protein
MYDKSTFAAASPLAGAASPLAGDCLTLVPEGANPVQVWLSVPRGERSASLLVESPPAAAGLVNYLAAVLVPLEGPTTSVPLELVVPHKGLGYLSDNDPQAQLVITWNVGTALTLCGLSGPA